ncbi:MAG TPA: LLM class F420-dependent oxidoreductase [Streptosporangiaceae bacterium]
MTVDLGRVGIWSRELRYNPDRGARAAAAAELEDLGYAAIFIPDAGGDVLGDVEHLLAATQRMPFATGILNIWLHDPAEVASGHARLVARFGPRFLLGLGNSHAPLVESALQVPYARPYSKMVEYLDALDGAAAPVPAEMRMLAALGPRMLSLARARAAAAHPYLVPPEHTAAARQALGPGILLAPEQAVVLSTDPRLGRERARAFVNDYLALPNYVRNLRRLGFTGDDLDGQASDRLVDALVAHGDEEAIAARVRAHHDAGADHVCVYVFGGGDEALPLDAWRRLAPALTSL